MHVGGISGFLHTIGYGIKIIRPTRVIIVFDGPGGSIRRKKLYPEYKANRSSKSILSTTGYFKTYEEENKSKKYQLKRLFSYLKQLPVQVILAHDVEADDVISYISTEVFNKSEIVIMSTDADYLQLIDDRICVWSPTKKKYYTKDSLEEEFEILSSNFLMYKMLMGDKSDNIPGIKGVGLKTIQKRLPIMLNEQNVSIKKLIEYAKNQFEATNEKGKKINDYKIYRDIIDSYNILKRNYDLMQLKDVDISRNSKIIVSNQIKQPINRLLKYKFLKLIIEDKLNIAIKNPDVWIKQVFLQLDGFASETNE